MSVRPNAKPVGKQVPSEGDKLGRILTIGLEKNRLEKRAAPVGTKELMLIPQPPAPPPMPPPPPVPGGSEADQEYDQLGRVMRGFRSEALLAKYRRPEQGYAAGKWQGETYIGNWQGGLPNGHGSIYGDDHYSGEWLDGLRHGQGTTQWTSLKGKAYNDPRFVGIWKEDMPFDGTEYDMEGGILGWVRQGVYERREKQASVMHYYTYTPYAS